MTNYDYYEAMREDLIEFIQEWKKFHKNKIARYVAVYDAAWESDAVTGNASGSYFFNVHESKEAVMANTDLLREAYAEFGCIDQLGNDFVAGNFEKMDVTIRCYLLGQVLTQDLIDN